MQDSHYKSKTRSKSLSSFSSREIGAIYKYSTFKIQNPNHKVETEQFNTPLIPKNLNT